MMGRHGAIVLRRDVRMELTLDALAACTGVHPVVLERYMEFGLIDPTEPIDPLGSPGQELVFDAAVVSRVRTIEHLRGEMGVNLAGVAVILDLLDRLRALQAENARRRD